IGVPCDAALAPGDRGNRDGWRRASMCRLGACHLERRRHHRSAPRGSCRAGCAAGRRLRAVARRCARGGPARAAHRAGGGAGGWMKRGLPFALTGLVANAQTRLAPMALGYASSEAELASFGVAARLDRIARRLPYAGIRAALPVFSSETPERGSSPAREGFDR